MQEKKVIIEVSDKHVHLSKQHIAALFGENYKLSPYKNLSQPGLYICKETVDVEGPSGTLKEITVIGPSRKQTQVELSMSQAIALGVAAPLRLSGELAGSGSIVLIGPKGSLEISEGAIIPKKHIHLPPENAAPLNLKEGQAIKVEVRGERPYVFEQVIVRISPQFRLRMHIDTDEAEAAGIAGETEAFIID